MQPKTKSFQNNAREALANDDLKARLSTMRHGFRERRAAAVNALPEFEAIRARAIEVKDHTLAHLDLYLEALEAAVVARGGKVHWCATAEEANALITDLCKLAQATSVVKSKSMVAEECGLNDHLSQAGLDVVETDLGEYVIQLRKEAPSHIIAPALHVSMDEMASSFKAEHRALEPERVLDTPRKLLDEARNVLRPRLGRADVGITGANFLVAETGTVVLVTNEGNADLGTIMPRVQIVLAGIEKVVPTLDDAALMLRLLARSATGQELSVYTTFLTGPRREGEPDGPQEFHLVLLDNGRSSMLGGPLEEMLRCIRCGACLNHCPIYSSIGGHAYGWVYPGPMGAVLSPVLLGYDTARHLPQASTLCGRCEEVCPMSIPIPRMLRELRRGDFQPMQFKANDFKTLPNRLATRAWAFLAQRPNYYHKVMKAASWLLRRLARGDGSIRRAPLAAGWTGTRDLPAPAAEPFLTQWAARRGQTEGAGHGRPQP